MNDAKIIDRIEPATWFVGMKNHRLQLMVYGKGIGSAMVCTDYPGVRIESCVRLDSPNYLLVYLNIKDAMPGTMNITFSANGNTQTIAYQLLLRAMRGEERQGFTNADVLYMLMPDRFASSGADRSNIEGMMPYSIDRRQPSLRHGGDINGIRQHLDYFKELGVTTLWLTPVLENNSPDNGTQSSYHGYATTNYYRVDPRLGSNHDYQCLVEEAHKKGLKVVMDMIFNHCGFHHPWLTDMPTNDWFNCHEWLTNGTQPRSLWPASINQAALASEQYVQTNYKLTPVLDPYASEVDKRNTVDGWFVPTMPDLNQRNPHLLTYLTQNSKWWIETVGIDGIRMDTYPYADRTAMAQWMEEINLEYPNFNTVGETWVTEPAYTAAWQKDSRLTQHNSHLKTVMDFALFDHLNLAKHEITDDWWNGYNRIYHTLCYDYLYANPSNVMAFIENHDTDRFLGNSTDTHALKQALALLLTINRIPQLYYGTEVLMNGTRHATDGNVRRDFPGGFPGDKHNAFSKKGRTKEQQQMFTWLSRLLHWRHNNSLISKGRQTQFIPTNGIYVVARTLNDQAALTIINGTNRQKKMHPEHYAEIIKHATVAKNILSGKTIRLDKDITISPRGTMILEFSTI